MSLSIYPSVDDTSVFINLNGKASLSEIAFENKQKYLKAQPFPHIVIDNLIDKEILSNIQEGFPDLSEMEGTERHSGSTDEKLASPRGRKFQTPLIASLLAFLNSSEFIDFLQDLTSIKEPLIPDPHFVAGGLHQVRRGGFLKIHTDFCKNHYTKLDRRINVLLYLNKNWPEEYGGHLEFYDKEMSECRQRILPTFNRMVIFNTNDFTYHGHPDPLTCPEDRTRNSLAIYYYSNGRPTNEIRTRLQNQFTIYKARPGEHFKPNTNIKSIVLQFIPPVAFPLARVIKKALSPSAAKARKRWD